jgi:oxidase EvaA
LRQDAAAPFEFCIQAKAEPGNIGTLQLSPTLQATRHNLDKVHQGKATPFAGILSGTQPASLVFSVAQNEDVGRFWRKENAVFVKVVVQGPCACDRFWRLSSDLGRAAGRSGRRDGRGFGLTKG